ITAGAGIDRDNDMRMTPLPAPVPWVGTKKLLADRQEVCDRALRRRAAGIPQGGGPSTAPCSVTPYRPHGTSLKGLFSRLSIGAAPPPVNAAAARGRRRGG